MIAAHNAQKVSSPLSLNPISVLLLHSTHARMRIRARTHLLSLALCSVKLLQEYPLLPSKFVIVTDVSSKPPPWSRVDESERQKQKEETMEGILTALRFPLKCLVDIFSKIRALIRPRTIFLLGSSGWKAIINHNTRLLKMSELNSSHWNWTTSYIDIMFAKKAYYY